MSASPSWPSGLGLHVWTREWRSEDGSVSCSVFVIYSCHYHVLLSSTLICYSIICGGGFTTQLRKRNQLFQLAWLVFVMLIVF